MLTLKRKTAYGLELMIYLAKAPGGQAISLKEISSKNKLPYKFLEQVVLPLRAAMLLEAQEGRGGGYFLTRKPSEISVAKIVEVLEGPPKAGQCSSCPIARVCDHRDIWVETGEKVRKSLEGKTLADLV